MGAASEAFRHPLRYARITAVVWATAWRMARLYRRGLDTTLAALRTAPPFGATLADPVAHLRVVARVLPLLPPFGLGRCLKRSLVLLALWSRCGLAVRLHLGFRPTAQGPWEGHAWLSCTGFDPPASLTSSNGHEELFVL